MVAERSAFDLVSVQEPCRGLRKGAGAARRVG